jgi:uncharacterized membrane protein HdeD (DUF308 family)
MMQTLIKRWWLLALCGVLNAIFSAMMFLILSPEGPPMLRIFRQVRSTAAQLGMLALAAGICTIVTGIWSLRKGSSWLLVLNGLAF